MAKKPQRKKIRRPAITWADKSLSEMSAKEIIYAKRRLEEGWKAELPTLQLYSFTGLDKERIEELKRRDPKMASIERQYENYLKTCSRLNVARDIYEVQDVQTSKWYLEHTDDEFKPASKVDVNAQQVVIPIEQKEAQMSQMFNDLFGEMNESTEGITGQSDERPSEVADGEDTEAL